VDVGDRIAPDNPVVLAEPGIRRPEHLLPVFVAGVPRRRLGTVREVASAYLHLMTNGFVTGQIFAVDGGVMLRK